MADAPYLTSFPLESGSRLVQIVLGRESHPTPRIVKDGFNIQSFVLNQTVGEPAENGVAPPQRVHFGLGGVSKRSSLIQLAQQADTLLTQAKGTPTDAQAGIFTNPLLLELLSRIASKLLEKYLK